MTKYIEFGGYTYPYPDNTRITWVFDIKVKIGEIWKSEIVRIISDTQPSESAVRNRAFNNISKSGVYIAKPRENIVVYYPPIRLP